LETYQRRRERSTPLERASRLPTCCGGGLATLLPGYAHLTADVDLAIDVAPEEARKVLRALVQNKFRPLVPVSAEAFADAATRETWLHERQMKALSLVDFANPMRVVDLLLKPEVPFDDLWNRSREAFINRTRVRIASLDDLLTLKRQSGKDLADIEQLEAIRRE
jgi:hypothetical protein